MSGSSFGKCFRITSFGESHGEALGVVIDGCPAGVPLTVDCLTGLLKRRRPGSSAFSTERNEADCPILLSGVFEGTTTGTPIAVLFQNETQRSSDYKNIAEYYRPGHADFTYDMKYGFRDYRGGGRSSGRETVARVAAGAVAMSLLKELSISICAYARSIHTFCCPSESEYLYSDFSSLSALALKRDENPLGLPDESTAEKAAAFLTKLKEEGNSAGGTIECVIKGVPSGLGEPVFDKFDACLAKAMLSIGAVKGFEIGSGFSSAEILGSENNDSFLSIDANRAKKKTNHAGGVLGGISDGSDVCFRVAVKPTPSIYLPQETIKKDGTTYTAEISGRHDPVIVPRAIVVVEAMAALVTADLLLQNAGSRLDKLK